MCHLNPLRYCLAPTARAFAAVTRTYQLAYCYTVLERNARRKVATVYGRDYRKPEERVNFFFPFDPYLLKISNKYIKDNYMVYSSNDTQYFMDSSAEEPLSRKRGDSEEDQEDEFIKADKYYKQLELSISQEFDKLFNFGSSPGFST